MTEGNRTPKIESDEENAGNQETGEDDSSMEMGTVGEPDGTSDDSAGDFVMVELPVTTGTEDETSDEEEVPRDQYTHQPTPQRDVQTLQPFESNTADRRHRKNDRHERQALLSACMCICFLYVACIVTLHVVDSDVNMLGTSIINGDNIASVNTDNPMNGGLPNATDVNAIEETQNQSNHAFLAINGNPEEYQCFPNETNGNLNMVPESTQPTSARFPLTIQNVRYRLRRTILSEAEEGSNDHQDSIPGLHPGGDNHNLTNTCSLDNWWNMLLIQLSNIPCLLREVTRLAEDAIEPFTKLLESYRLWRTGHMSEAKTILCGNRDMRSSEPARILGILESQLRHFFVFSSGVIEPLLHVILNGKRDNGSAWGSLAEACTAYERRPGHIRFERPPVFLSLPLGNLRNFRENTDSISESIPFAGARYYLAAVTYIVAGNTTEIHHLVSRVFVPNGTFSADGLPMGRWWFYSNSGDGRLVPFTSPPACYRLSMAHYVICFQPGECEEEQPGHGDDVQPGHGDDVQPGHPP